jgi:hypothetical protein
MILRLSIFGHLTPMQWMVGLELVRYTLQHTMSKISNADNAKDSNEAMDDHQEWGEHGVVLISIASIEKKHAPSRLLLMIKN